MERRTLNDEFIFRESGGKKHLHLLEEKVKGDEG